MSRLEQVVAPQAGSLPDILDFEWLEVCEGVVQARVEVIALFRCTQMLFYPTIGAQA